MSDPPLAWHGCDANGCLDSAREEFTVGERPPGVEGLEGWPEGAPELRAPLALHLPSGAVIRFCWPHARQLREAAYRQQGSLYGIRPHRLMSDAERALARQLAETPPLDPEQARRLLGDQP